MRSSFRYVAMTAVAVAAIVVITQPAYAVCGAVQSRGITMSVAGGYSGFVNPALASAYPYGTFYPLAVDGPPVSADFRGFFWILGSANQAVTGPTGGVDNGTWPALYLSAGYSYGWVSDGLGYDPVNNNYLNTIYPGYFYPAKIINKAWNTDAGIDGCPDDVGNGCMLILVEDQHDDGQGNPVADWAILADPASGTLNYDFALSGVNNVLLAPLPRALFGNPVRDGSNNLSVSLSFADPNGAGPGGGIYTDRSAFLNNDGNCDFGGSLITGYRLFVAGPLTNATPRPALNDVAFTDISPDQGTDGIPDTIAFGAGPTVQIGNCGGAGDQDANFYVATALELDGNVYTGLSQSFRVTCDSNLADPDPVNPSLIEPRERPGRGDRGRGRR